MNSLLLTLSDHPLFGILTAPDRGGINVGFYFFKLPIHYYALCIITGMVVAAVLSALMMKRRNMSPDLIYTLFIFCIPDRKSVV